MLLGADMVGGGLAGILLGGDVSVAQPAKIRTSMLETCLSFSLRKSELFAMVNLFSIFVSSSLENAVRIEKRRGVWLEMRRCLWRFGGSCIYSNVDFSGTRQWGGCSDWESVRSRVQRRHRPWADRVSRRHRRCCTDALLPRSNRVGVAALIRLRPPTAAA